MSNDNPYSESLFKTLKYRPAYPLQAFDTLFAARTWVAGLVRWYNHEHRHSAIRFVTPAERHAHLDQEILARRATLYERARATKSAALERPHAQLAAHSSSPFESRSC